MEILMLLVRILGFIDLSTEFFGVMIGAFFAFLSAFAIQMIIFYRDKNIREAREKRETDKETQRNHQRNHETKMRLSHERKSDIKRTISAMQSRQFTIHQLYRRAEHSFMQNMKYSYLAEHETDGLISFDKSKSKNDWLGEANIALKTYNQYLLPLIEELRKTAEDSYRLSGYCKQKLDVESIFQLVQSFLKTFATQDVNFDEPNSFESFVNHEDENLEKYCNRVKIATKDLINNLDKYLAL